MVKMIEPPFEKNQFQLTEHYRVSIDRMNVTLHERYRKREGKGRDAPFSNMYGYGNEKYYRTLKRLLTVLINNEITDILQETISDNDKKTFQAVVDKLDRIEKHIDAVVDDVSKKVDKKIEINLEPAKKKPKQTVKGVTIEDGEED